ncbi:hypothetical protein BTO30_16095 [Domibacillus antri]|uniref:Methyl-accepting chemotaxis protein n=1 Tax=Domibacillus antri TaxID=1714264 RepID=A0A1Q8Q1R2_9BACI|nr:hypothetical protein BTO30_16095 [Domibacillus antri]
MLLFRNRKISQKYGIVLAIVIILFLIATVFTSLILNDLTKKLDDLDRKGEQALVLSEMGSLLRAKDIRVSDFILLEEPISIDQYNQQSDKLNALEEQISSVLTSPAQEGILNQIKANDNEMNRIFFEMIIPSVQQKKEPEVLYLKQMSANLRTQTIQYIDDLQINLKTEYSAAVDRAKAQARQALLILLISVVAASIISIILSMLISRIVDSNLRKVVTVSNDIAQGKLNVEPINYDGKDDIGQLASSTNLMAENLRNIISQLLSVAEHVKSQSGTLKMMSNEVKDGSEQIATAMDEMAQGAEQQADAASNISELIESLNRQITDAREDGEQLSSSSEHVLHLSGDGRVQMEHTAHQMEQITTLVSSSVEKVRGLEQRTMEISHLVKVIQDISAQTNLLALNAAIEAARAGEHGRGFAVVADEVRKLAVQVDDSVKEITGIINGVQEETTDVVTSLNDGFEEVEKGSKAMVDTTETFAGIIDSVNDMASKIQMISTRLDSINDGSDKISSSSQEVASVSEESSAGVEETAAASRQLYASMEDIQESAQSLAQLSEELEQTVKQFTL